MDDAERLQEVKKIQLLAVLEASNLVRRGVIKSEMMLNYDFMSGLALGINITTNRILNLFSQEEKDRISADLEKRFSDLEKPNEDAFGAGSN